jgi:hypothetical protein
MSENALLRLPTAAPQGSIRERYARPLGEPFGQLLSSGTASPAKKPGVSAVYAR